MPRTYRTITYRITAAQETDWGPVYYDGYEVLGPEAYDVTFATREEAEALAQQLEADQGDYGLSGLTYSVIEDVTWSDGHFTIDSSEFDGDELDTINATYAALIADWQTKDGQGAKSLADAITNCWVEGDTVDGLINKVTPLGRRNMGADV